MKFITVKPIFDAVRFVGGKLDQRDVFAIEGAIAAAQRENSETPIFDVARRLDDDADGLSQIEVDAIRRGIAAALAGFAEAAATGNTRQIGAKGLALIKKYEGLQLKAYLCPAKVWTIGYGSTGPHVTPGKTITEAEADAILQRDLDRFEDAVAKAAPDATQNQFDAMVSLAFNIGIGAFQGSTVLRKHKAGDHRGANAAFGMWNKARGKVLVGLSRRRADEARLYWGA